MQTNKLQVFPDESGSLLSSILVAGTVLLVLEAAVSSAIPAEFVVVVCDSGASVVAALLPTPPAAFVAWVDVAPEQVLTSVLPHPFILHPVSQYPSSNHMHVELPSLFTVSTHNVQSVILPQSALSLISSSASVQISLTVMPLKPPVLE